MQREMTKTEKILDNIALANLALIIVAISTIFMNNNDVESMPIIIRHVFSFLRHHTALFSLMNFGIMMICAFWSVILGNCLDAREKEYSEKYLLSNDSSTKSRVELIKLQERGY